MMLIIYSYGNFHLDLDMACSGLCKSPNLALLRAGAFLPRFLQLQPGILSNFTTDHNLSLVRP
jgi:hypothetical protein